MSQSLSSSIIDSALALPPSDRARLADILLDSLDCPIDPQIAKAIAEDAKRRIDEYDRGETTSISKDDFLAWRRAKWSR